MVIVKLMGGLGNQMFQYAAGKSLALKLHSSLKADPDWFKTQHGDTLRHFNLDTFKLHLEIANKIDLYPFYMARMWPRLSPLIGISYVKEKLFNPMRGYKHVYLDGYFTHPKYFESHEATIRNDFIFSSNMTRNSNKWLDLITNTASIAVHIRRGDYAHNPKTQAFHGLLPLAYYQKALHMMRGRLGGNVTFFIFSDDLPWVKAHFISPYLQYVDMDNEPDFETLRLMSLCKHHIIANSTFSWWGAWLAKHPEQIVIAPHYWWANKEPETGFYMKSWIIAEN